MFADPIVVSKDTSVTPGATNQENLVKNYVSGQISRYEESGGDISLEISHQDTNSGRSRHLCKVKQRKVAADPYTAVNTDVELTAHIVIDEPNFGFTDAEIQEAARRLMGVLTDANIAKLLNKES